MMMGKQRKLEKIVQRFPCIDWRPQKETQFLFYVNLKMWGYVFSISGAYLGLGQVN